MKVYLVFISSGILLHTRVSGVYQNKEMAEWIVETNNKIGAHSFIVEYGVDQLISRNHAAMMSSKYGIVYPEEYLEPLNADPSD